MILITTYYKSPNEERQKEINYCLQKNVENKHIEKIVLLNNKIFNLPVVSDKIEQIKINKSKEYKLKFCDAIHYIDTNFQGKICILANSDIYFDNTLGKITDENISGKLFALNKYNLTKDGEIEFDSRIISQDSWIFKSPLNIDYSNINYSLGTLGCDCNFAYRAHMSNIIVTNPSLDIITTHYHLSNFRTYNLSNIVKGTCIALKPTYLTDISEKIYFNLST